MVIFLSGAVFSIGEGIERLVSGKATEGSPIVVYVVLVVSLIAEGISLARAVRQTRAQQRESGLPLMRYVRQSRDPTTKTVFTEDSVAVTGVLIALIGFSITEITGSPVGDAGGSIFIGLLLAGVAVALAKDTKGLLVGESARPEERAKLRDVLDGREEVVHVIDFRTLALGPTELLVAARVDLADDLDSSDVERVADEIDRELREAVPEVKEVFLDPTSRDGAASGVRPRP
jgi:cation diffusion facilitator family transporter